MKKWLMGVWIALFITLYAGFSENTFLKTRGLNQSSRRTENQSDKEKSKMTEQQEEVLRSYGLPDEEIERMKREGLSYKEQSFVDTAVMMLNYLEKKYGEKFQVVGGDIPGILSDEYWITAEALEGAQAGEKFDVYYLGENGYTDGYTALLKQEEACTALNKLIQKEFSNVLIFSSVSGEYGGELTPDNTGEELLKTVYYDYNIIITDSDMTEEKFNQLSESIKKLLDDNNVNSSGVVRYLNVPADPDMTAGDFEELLNNLAAFRWNNFISSR